MEAQMSSKLTAALTVRVSPEADRLRRELEAEMKLPANRVVEAALHTLKAELERSRSVPETFPDGIKAYPHAGGDA
jgi:hypothetical protein